MLRYCGVFAALALVLCVSVQANDMNLRRILRLARERQGLENELPAKGVVTAYFNQTLDHFSTSSATYQQRFYVYDAFYAAKPESPVFIYVGGEAALTARAVSAGFIVDLAKEFGGLIVGLEHRFYGLSQPFNLLSTENLAMLSSQQALADVANFRSYIVDAYHTGSSPWVSVGGSYPGNLSAWLRLKYPHLFVASLASSAPVMAKADFYEYDQVVAASAGAECASRLRKATAQVEAALADPTSAAAMKAAFDCSEIADDTEFLYVIADMAAFAIQYKDSVGDKLCAPIVSSSDPLAAYQTYAKWLLNDYLKTDARTFDIADFTDETWTENSNMRQWMYQSCREFGYFQVAPAQNSLRSTRITLQWHYDVCTKLFNQALVPTIDWTNTYYGGNNTASSNTFFTNGDKDPWHYLGVQHDLSSTDLAEVIAGTAHCADLHAPSPSDPASLTAARKHVAGSIKTWLNSNGKMVVM